MTRENKPGNVKHPFLNGSDRVILIADFGRSGQGWLSYMLCYILNARYIEPYTFLRGIIFSSNAKALALTQGNLPGREKTKYSMVIKTHELPDPYFSLTDKVILLARDPRDVAVSGQARAIVRNETGTDVETGAQTMLIGRDAPGAVAGPSLRERLNPLRALKMSLLRSKLAYAYVTAKRWRGFYEAWEQISITYKVTYESLHSDPKAALKSILKYLDFEASDALIDEAIEVFSFESLTGRRKGSEEKGNVAFRKGVVGDYQNHFGPLHQKVFREVCGEIASRWNYKL
ncbi:MAG: sulfotransferase domain-containing protein [Bacteriovoracia bacterium]